MDKENFQKQPQPSVVPQPLEDSSVARRFCGAGGKARLIQALYKQPLVANNLKLAKALVGNGELLSAKKGKKIIIQGHSDNDIYFIISGSVAIFVNGRELMHRSSGNYVGEMALLDPTSVRSATVKVIEQTVLLRITESKFSRIAIRYPDVWRRMATELANRLRQRSKFHKEPHAQPVLFVGSSKEGLYIATHITDSLMKDPIIPRPWSEGVFQVSETAIEDLWKATDAADFALLIFTPDDITISKGKKKVSPRDNVVFELGLFTGALGRERTFILAPENLDLKIPTDLLGVTRFSYKKGSKKNIRYRFRGIINDLRRVITELGPK